MRRLAPVLVLATAAACRPEARADEPAREPGVAVVELFTSEGCSSCPPADAVLADLVRAGDPRVYPLALHVDYWDELGWPDRFASPENTARQRAYAGALGGRGLYTPQAIVDGTDAFVGSDAGQTREAVARALARPVAVRLSVAARRAGPDAVAVDCTATGPAAGATLEVAVVAREAVTAVRAGENAGKTLRHANVVVGLAAAPVGGDGRATALVRVPRWLRGEDAEVIAYLQRPAAKPSGGGIPVLGAARAPVHPEPSRP
jgi:hypothetical protein